MRRPLRSQQSLTLLLALVAGVFPLTLQAQGDVTQPPATSERPSPATPKPHLEFPPWAEVDVACPADPPTVEYDFRPDLTALPRILRETFGPSNGLCCNLADGVESYVPFADLIVHNPRGGEMIFKRSFRSDRALAGYGSPGLSPGWVHGYDVAIKVQPGAAPWSPMLMIYPNGQKSVIKPALDVNGQPTGEMVHTGGAPFVAVGVPADAMGHWQTITLSWQNRSTWTFIPLDEQTYVLKRINNIAIGWDKGRRLLGAYDADTNKVMMTLAYDANGLLSSVVDADGVKRTYFFDVPPQTGLKSASLLAVSQMVAGNPQDIPMQCAYTYIAQDGKPLLHTITLPSPTGKGMSTASIEYRGGKVAAHIDANGNQHVYTYGETGTLVQIKDPAGKVVSFWTQNLDALGRNIGITDADGRSTKITYR